MNVAFVSQSEETLEVYVIFDANGYLTPLLIVGRTRAAVVAFDRSHLCLPEIPVGREIEETFNLCNTEDLPLNFKFDKTTLSCNDGSDKLLISPNAGCVQPNQR